jgi:hypothetical protein
VTTALAASLLPLLTGQLRTTGLLSKGDALSLGISSDAWMLVLLASEQAPADLRVCWQEIIAASNTCKLDAAAAMSMHDPLHP